MPTRLPVPLLLALLASVAAVVGVAAGLTAAGATSTLPSLAAVPLLLCLGALAPRLAGGLPAPVGVVLAWVLAAAWGVALAPTLSWWTAAPWSRLPGAVVGTLAVLGLALGAAPLREGAARLAVGILLGGTALLLAMLGLEQAVPEPWVEQVATAGVVLLAALLVVVGVAVGDRADASADEALAPSQRAAVTTLAVLGPLVVCFTGLLPLVG
ncbi:MAG: hypothetical protein H6732_18350 [Alphaproteobacteria bacterium]|nr:hypothetical protein [Alphaproteobacteria bacterium]